MKWKLYIVFAAFALFNSCRNESTKNEPNANTPEAFKEDETSFDLRSSKTRINIVDDIYNELLSKNQELKEVEEKIDELGHRKPEAIQKFKDYNEKNLDYYSSVEVHISNIKDSILRTNVKNMVGKKLDSYNKSMSHHNDLVYLIEERSIKINDLHKILKIVKTLEIIEKYQVTNMPSSKPMESYLKEQDVTIKQIELLSKK